MSDDSPEKQALDGMEKLIKEMNEGFPTITRIEHLRMLWTAFELGKQRQGFIRNIPEIEPVTKRCVTVSET